MANEDHLTILRKGVEVWNKWRKENSEMRIDLTGANLSKVDLSEFDLSRTDLAKANLSEAELFKTELVEADLSEANLVKAHIIRTELLEANLSKANLSESDVSLADIRWANLSGANLSKAYFGAADLSGADLSGADLSEADLSEIRAIETNFTAAKLTGVCLQDWNINSATNLTGVNCDYVYLQKKKRERRPISGIFAPEEFTKLFQKSLETVDLIFRNGIDWNAFAYSFKKLEVENQGAQLDVQSIEKKGDGILVVRVAVTPDADKAKIHSEFMQGYEFAAKALEAQYQARLEDKDTLISKQEAQINRLFDIVEQQGSVQKALAENPRKVSNYNMQNPQFASGIVDANNVDADQIGGNIQNNDA
ncbi:pentapeptide repeat-containing protein (plasmid) [Nostoc sp. C057]|nr:pentapeptide repeat-containing protein [Nostoc sp. C057]